jgi:hypothetical protein
MNLQGEKTPRASQHDMGWNAERTYPLLRVAGKLFPLTLPFIISCNATNQDLLAGTVGYLRKGNCSLLGSKLLCQLPRIGHRKRSSALNRGPLDEE